MKADDAIGRWYDAQRKEAARLWDELAAEEAKPQPDGDRIKDLNQRLERALYLGD